jgi:serine/threonine protein phosphatase PrpC
MSDKGVLMAMPQLRTVTLPVLPGARPRDEDLDLFGLTHPGKVRHENQDHFLLATLHRQLAVHGTSLPDQNRLETRSERLATVMLVADGVGGGVAGGEASRIATETVTRYVTSTMQCLHMAGGGGDEALLESLREAALQAHDAVMAEAAARLSGDRAESEGRGMATTLTLAIAIWPWLYILQVGDSRCYHYCGGVLRQITRDQTVVQGLVDAGVMTPQSAAQSPFSNVLASSIGGEARPVVSRIDIHERGCVVLLCSDGLTKHVEDAQIAETMRTMTSCEQACRDLLARALERGGTDNITVLAGRARANAGPVRA